MGLRVNTNIASVNAQRNLAAVTSKLAGSYERLSTGLRITRGADDAAGLAISERLRAQVRSLRQAERNANDGISFVTTGEGALNTVSELLIRMRELTMQSANGATADRDKATINEEFRSLIEEIDRIANSTQFNGVNLLDGSATSVSFQVGISSSTGMDVLDLSLSPALATSLGLASLDIGSTGNTGSAMQALDAAINTITGLRGRLGAVQNRLRSTIETISISGENLTAAESRIRDADVAFESAELTRNSIMQQAAISVLAQANLQPQIALQLLQG